MSMRQHERLATELSEGREARHERLATVQSRWKREREARLARREIGSLE